jgi:hypothetical protein
MTTGVTPEPRVHIPSPPDMFAQKSSHYLGACAHLLFFQPAGLALLGSNMCARQRAKYPRSMHAYERGVAEAAGNNERVLPLRAFTAALVQLGQCPECVETSRAPWVVTACSPSVHYRLKLKLKLLPRCQLNGLLAVSSTLRYAAAAAQERLRLLLAASRPRNSPVGLFSETSSRHLSTVA